MLGHPVGCGQNAETVAGPRIAIPRRARGAGGGDDRALSGAIWLPVRVTCAGHTGTSGLLHEAQEAWVKQFSKWVSKIFDVFSYSY